MKKTMKHILALVIILPLIFAGCQKSETIEAERSNDTGNLKSTIEYCGDPYAANLVDWDQTLTAGTLTVGNDADNFFALFEVSSTKSAPMSVKSIFASPCTPGTFVSSTG